MSNDTIQAFITLWRQYQVYLQTNTVQAPQSFGAFMDWLVQQPGA